MSVTVRFSEPITQGPDLRTFADCDEAVVDERTVRVDVGGVRAVLAVAVDDSWELLDAPYACRYRHVEITRHPAAGGHAAVR